MAYKRTRSLTGKDNVFYRVSKTLEGCLSPLKLGDIVGEGSTARVWELVDETGKPTNKVVKYPATLREYILTLEAYKCDKALPLTYFPRFCAAGSTKDGYLFMPRASGNLQGAKSITGSEVTGLFVMLNRLHECGIIHNDVHLGNVMRLMGNASLVFGDFGYSQYFPPNKRDTPEFQTLKEKDKRLLLKHLGNVFNVPANLAAVKANDVFHNTADLNIVTQDEGQYPRVVTLQECLGPRYIAGSLPDSEKTVEVFDAETKESALLIAKYPITHNEYQITLAAHNCIKPDNTPPKFCLHKMGAKGFMVMGKPMQKLNSMVELTGEQANEIIEMLNKLHGCGVIHGELRADNIAMMQGGRFFLVNYEKAQFLSERQRMTLDGIAKMTRERRTMRSILELLFSVPETGKISPGAVFPRSSPYLFS